MDLTKIKTLIDFVGRSQVRELSVTEHDCTIRIFKTSEDGSGTGADEAVSGSVVTSKTSDCGQAAQSATPVAAPIFGVLHRASAPGQAPFVQTGDLVEEGQTLFIIEAMKVFNKIAAPCAGRITFLTDIDGGEVETNDLLAEIAR